MATRFTHTKSSTGHDSRQYSTRRRKSCFGYFEPPVVDDTLSFLLPPFSRVHSRTVAMKGRTWEAWSPNSLVDAYYPGIRAPGYNVAMEVDPTKRRFDGHLGRFDPTKSPQHYDPRQPWLALVRRERASPTKIEHTPLWTAWVSLPPRGGIKDLGRLDTAYLLQLTTRNIELDATMSAKNGIASIKAEYWENRPVEPLESEIQGLKGDLRFADAVDKVASVQRGIKLKDAWIRTMNIVAKDQMEAISEDWLSEVPFASENVLGTWINGAKENEVYWLLKHRIPCFIIHEISVSELCFHLEDPKNPDFVALTDAAYLLAEHNGFDHLALKWKALINAIAGQEGMPPILPILSAEERAGSNPRAQGWDGEKHRLLEETPEVVMRPVQCSISAQETLTNQQSSRTDSTAHIPEPEVRTLAKDRVEWLVPPAIMAVTAGKWTYWKEEDLDRNTSCFCPVTSRPIDCARVCYDRIERRELFFIENLEIPHGAVSDINVFGFPAPAARFVELSDGMVTKEYRASHWLYTEKDAKKGTVGQRAPTPPPSELPLTSVLRKNSYKTSLPTTESTMSQPVLPSLSTSVEKTGAPPPQRPIPTEPRALRQKSIPIIQNSGESRSESSLGRRPRTRTLEGGDSSNERGNVLSKKLRGSEISAEKDNDNQMSIPALSTPSVPPLPELEERSPHPPALLEVTATDAPRTTVDAIAESSSDSRFLCFEGLPWDWEACCSWFYGIAVSSHIVWINQMYRTVSDSRPLIWVDMKNNEDACKLRGYSTHRTTPDQSLVISHFVSEATYMEAIRNCTDKWERPSAPPQPTSDDPMEGPSRHPPLEMRLTSPERASPTPDVSLLHRAGVTLEERVEMPPRRQRGGAKHKKLKAKYKSNS